MKVRYNISEKLYANFLFETMKRQKHVLTQMPEQRLRYNGVLFHTHFVSFVKYFLRTFTPMNFYKPSSRYMNALLLFGDTESRGGKQAMGFSISSFLQPGFRVFSQPLGVFFISESFRHEFQIYVFRNEFLAFYS